ncbi:hypothetical protein [Bradyrhizobium sp. 191]|uniref:hypothetical protein n=1 Tax=Bradyrhizobium sp. 191 TaxID=2782659 RepID=UPI001FFFFB54|nr:hypothetical protein [Bradyrhizobium sp. 191]UPJ63510.1 hypothetical protein IVB23_26255 [Bradyrhizobium sp. 191]
MATNPMFDNSRLIDANGAVDIAFIQVSARARASSRYGVDCTESDVTYYVEMLTGMAGMLRAKFLEAAATTPIATAVPSIRVPSRYLVAGDVTGSGERVVCVSAGVRTRRGKIEVTLERAGKRRTSVWGASTVISVRRAAQ